MLCSVAQDLGGDFPYPMVILMVQIDLCFTGVVICAAVGKRVHVTAKTATIMVNVG